MHYAIMVCFFYAMLWADISGRYHAYWPILGFSQPITHAICEVNLAVYWPIMPYETHAPNYLYTRVAHNNGTALTVSRVHFVLCVSWLFSVSKNRNFNFARIKPWMNRQRKASTISCCSPTRSTSSGVASWSRFTRSVFACAQSTRLRNQSRLQREMSGRIRCRRQLVTPYPTPLYVRYHRIASILC